jgi:hypothetical protein
VSILKALVLISFLFIGSWPSLGLPAQTLSLCELAKAPGLRDAEVVRIRAFFSVEEGILYDTNCNNRDSWAYVTVSDGDVVRAVDAGARQSGRLIVTGVFEGEWAAPDGDGYGPLGYYRLQVQVQRVEGARLAPRGTVRPNDAADAPLSRARAELWGIDGGWMLARMTHDVEALSKIVSDNYVMVPAQGDVIYNGGLLSALPALSSSGKTEEAAESSWRKRVFVWDEETGAVIGRMIPLQGSTGKEGPECGAYTNFYRRVRGSWSLAMTVCEPAGSLAGN